MAHYLGLNRYKEHDWERVRQSLAQSGLFDEALGIKPVQGERVSRPNSTVLHRNRHRNPLRGRAFATRSTTTSTPQLHQRLPEETLICHLPRSTSTRLRRPSLAAKKPCAMAIAPWNTDPSTSCSKLAMRSAPRW
jgi:hypothetical protein